MGFRGDLPKQSLRHMNKHIFVNKPMQSSSEELDERSIFEQV